MLTVKQNVKSMIFTKKVCLLLILNVSAKKRHLCAGVTLASAGEYDIGMILPQPISDQRRVV